MILPSQKDAIHRGQMYRLLIEIAGDRVLSKSLIFKGGTCAALLGRLDRFSVDLDFSILSVKANADIRLAFEEIFSRLNLRIADESKGGLQYFLKYDAPLGGRNSLKIDAVGIALKSDKYEAAFLSDIERYLLCQTIETQFAHKLVAVLDRYEKHHSIAGRDLYDIHFFFLNQYRFHEEIIIERTGLNSREFIKKLIDFIEKHVTETVINEDINMLLPYEKFNAIRKSLKYEVISMLKTEAGCGL